MKWVVISRSKRHKAVRLQEVDRLCVRVGGLCRVIGWGGQKDERCYRREVVGATREKSQ